MAQENLGASSFEGEFLVANINIKKRRLKRVSQGDVFRNVECIEYVAEKRGTIEVSKIEFPLVVVLTQDCDLEQDARYKIKGKEKPPSDDKRLFSVLVAPLYNAEHVFQGSHLADLKLKMQTIDSKRAKTLKQNETPRYHYLDFPANTPVVSQVIDFKHYFSVNLSYLEKIRRQNFVCQISELFREDMSQRFAAYLARIGLPDIINQNS